MGIHHFVRAIELDVRGDKIDDIVVELKQLAKQLDAAAEHGNTMFRFGWSIGDEQYTVLVASDTHIGRLLNEIMYKRVWPDEQNRNIFGPCQVSLLDPLR